MTQDQKDLLQSKTFWGAVIALAATVCHWFGITIDQQVWVNDALTVAGTAIALYGRVVATKPVTSVAGLTSKSAADKKAGVKVNA